MNTNNIGHWDLRDFAEIKQFDPVAWKFVNGLLDAGVVVWSAHPNPSWDKGSEGQEFNRPQGWQNLIPQSRPKPTYDPFFGSFTAGDCLCANAGVRVAAIDVDFQHGADIDAVRALLADLATRIFAEVATPGGGRHFYIAGHPDLPNKGLNTLTGF